MVRQAGEFAGKPVVQLSTLIAVIGLLVTIIVATRNIDHSIARREKEFLERLNSLDTRIAVVGNEVNSLRNYAASMDTNLKSIASRVDVKPTREEIRDMMESVIETRLSPIRERLAALEAEKRRED